MAGYGGANWMQIGNSSGQATQSLIQLAIAKDKNDKLKGMNDQYAIPPEIYANLSDANKMAMEGMSASEANAYAANVNKGLTFANAGADDRKAGLIGTAEANQTADNAMLNQSAMSDSIRRGNQQTLYGMRNQLADYKDMQWTHNVDQPYKYLQGQRDAYFTASGRQFSNAMASSAGSGGDAGGIGKENTNQPTPSYPAKRDMGVTGTSPYAYGYDPNATDYGVTNPYYNPNQNSFMLNSYKKPNQ